MEGGGEILKPAKILLFQRKERETSVRPKVANCTLTKARLNSSPLTEKATLFAMHNKGGERDMENQKGENENPPSLARTHLRFVYLGKTLFIIQPASSSLAAAAVGGIHFVS